MTRLESMLAPISPVGSQVSRRRPSKGPPCLWKYHQGRPFCTGTNAVSAPNKGPMDLATEAICWVLSARMTRSWGPASAILDVALAGLAVSSLPSGPITLSPFFRMASRCAPISIKVTSSPARANFTPTNPPMAPAPTTHTFIETLHHSIPLVAAQPLPGEREVRQLPIPKQWNRTVRGFNRLRIARACPAWSLLLLGSPQTKAVPRLLDRVVQAADAVDADLHFAAGLHGADANGRAAGDDITRQQGQVL